MSYAVDFRSPNGIQVPIVGLLLFVSGCAPSIAPSIDTDREGKLQSISRSSLQPLIGCYEYEGHKPNCTNCGTSSFFPFPVGMKDDPPGGITYLENGNRKSGDNERLEADSICLQAEGKHSIRAVAYQEDEPVAAKLFEGEVREDGYFIIDSYTQAKMTWVPVFWFLGQGQPAFAVNSTGDLYTVDAQAGVILLVFFPTFGSNFTESTRFEKVSGPPTSSKSNQSGP